jgi:hypothetical protein
MLKETGMQLQPKKVISMRFALVALFILACVLYYSYSNIQKKASHSVILKKSCLKKKVSDISTFLKDRSENFNLQHEDCNIISTTMDQIFDLGKKCVLFFRALRLSDCESWVKMRQKKPRASLSGKPRNQHFAL